MNETIAKYEIMDGAPVRGESIPIRVFLAGYDLTPTMRDINKKFSVRYYLNLVLVDEEERRYFKQQEITLWRKGERVRKLPLANSLYQQQHALARHDAGDQPTEGVRTAPTPSQPPTPYADSEKPLPGEILQEEVEEQNDEKIGNIDNVMKNNSVSAEKFAEMEDKLAAATEEKCVISDSSVSPPETINPPDLVSQVPPLPPTTPDGVPGSGETDSLADLDIVAVSGDPRPDSPPEHLDSPPETMSTPPDALDTPPDTPGSPVISLPDAPSSDPGSPEIPVKKGVKEAVAVADGL